MFVKHILCVSIISAMAVSGQTWAANESMQHNSSQTSNQQMGGISQATSSAALKNRKGQTKKKYKTPQKVITLNGIKVTGIRRSQMRAIELKRTAPSIQDSITSVSIGQLPDITIANSLSRITGVQVDRSAGEGTGINIRGLPEVSTLINGGAFITADNIYSIQPNYETLPSSLFAGVDVIKSPTADTLASGISGTVNLRTRQPWNLPFGWTVAGAVEGGRGSMAKKTRPNGNLLLNYNDDGRWGVLFAASYSGFVHSFGGQGFSSETLAGENSSSANIPSLGYLTAWGKRPGGIPSRVVPLPDGGVDVNGDGKSNGAFLSPTRYRGFNDIVQPKRLGLNSAFQYAFDHGLTLTMDGFFTRQTKYDDDQGIYTLNATQQAPTGLPLVSRETNAVLHNPLNTPGVQTGDWNQHFFTTQADQVLIGDEEPTTTDTKGQSISRNFNVDLKLDNGGAFTGDLRWINASASRTSNTDVFQLSSNDGSGWPNTLMPGVSLPPTVYPVPGGAGSEVFNPNGIPPLSYSYKVNWQGKNPVLSLPGNIRSRLLDESTYGIKSWFYAAGNTQRAAMDNIRFDGHYRFSDQFSVDFGARNSIRSGQLTSYVWGSREYAGEGASDPNGCTVRWRTADTILNGAGIAGACSAGNALGFYHGTPVIGMASQAPAFVSSNLVKLINPGDSIGLVGWDLSPSVGKNPVPTLIKALGGRKNLVRVTTPANSWHVLLKTRTLYGQANFSGLLAGHRFSGNAGVRIIRTNLGVTQNITGQNRPYGMPLTQAGIIATKRNYTDILPALNVAINVTPKLVLRLAGSKNMMPLSLNQWGGGFSRGFTFTILPNGNGVFAASSASSSGNPDLKPWRSTNFGASLEYYMSRTSMISLAAFRIRVASFVSSGTTSACNIPDQDGVVRRCIPLTTLVQQGGTTLHGLEFDYRQGLDFLPGLLANTGFQINGTLSPSDTGKKDLAGKPIPFPDNSKKEASVTLWYQDSRLQIHVGANYRSKRAVSSDFNGINGMEEYQAPTVYVDASISYQATPHIQVYAQGENLTDERQKFYLVWPDEKFNSRISERYYMLGARFRF